MPTDAQHDIAQSDLHDLLLFVLAVFDDLARLATEQNVGRLLLIAVAISVVGLVVGLSLVAILLAGRAIMATVAWLATMGARR